MALMRTRLASFMAGFACAAAGSYYFLHQELQAGHRSLSHQADQWHSGLEARIARLEKIIQPTSGESTHPNEQQP
eukprot:c10418_g1_i1 orf=384-608(-)